MPRLTGKTALVTGAARGIGTAIAHAFADEGVCSGSVQNDTLSPQYTLAVVS